MAEDVFKQGLDIIKSSLEESTPASEQTPEDPWYYTPLKYGLQVLSGLGWMLSRPQAVGTGIGYEVGEDLGKALAAFDQDSPLKGLGYILRSFTIAPLEGVAHIFEGYETHPVLGEHGLKKLKQAYGIGDPNNAGFFQTLLFDLATDPLTYVSGGVVPGIRLGLKTTIKNFAKEFGTEAATHLAGITATISAAEKTLKTAGVGETATKGLLKMLSKAENPRELKGIAATVRNVFEEGILTDVDTGTDFGKIFTETFNDEFVKHVDTLKRGMTPGALEKLLKPTRTSVDLTKALYFGKTIGPWGKIYKVFGELNPKKIEDGVYRLDTELGESSRLTKLIRTGALTLDGVDQAISAVVPVNVRRWIVNTLEFYTSKVGGVNGLSPQEVLIKQLEVLKNENPFLYNRVWKRIKRGLKEDPGVFVHQGDEIEKILKGAKDYTKLLDKPHLSKSDLDEIANGLYRVSGERPDFFWKEITEGNPTYYKWLFQSTLERVFKTPYASESAQKVGRITHRLINPFMPIDVSVNVGKRIYSAIRGEYNKALNDLAGIFFEHPATDLLKSTAKTVVSLPLKAFNQNLSGIRDMLFFQPSRPEAAKALNQSIEEVRGSYYDDVEALINAFLHDEELHARYLKEDADHQILLDAWNHATGPEAKQSFLNRWENHPEAERIFDWVAKTRETMETSLEHFGVLYTRGNETVWREHTKYYLLPTLKVDVVDDLERFINSKNLSHILESATHGNTLAEHATKRGKLMTGVNPDNMFEVMDTVNIQRDPETVMDILGIKEGQAREMLKPAIEEYFSKRGNDVKILEDNFFTLLADKLDNHTAAAINNEFAFKTAEDFGVVRTAQHKLTDQYKEAYTQLKHGPRPLNIPEVIERRVEWIDDLPKPSDGHTFGVLRKDLYQAYVRTRELRDWVAIRSEAGAKLLDVYLAKLENLYNKSPHGFVGLSPDDLRDLIEIQTKVRLYTDTKEVRSFLETHAPDWLRTQPNFEIPGIQTTPDLSAVSRQIEEVERFAKETTETATHYAERKGIPTTPAEKSTISKHLSGEPVVELIPPIREIPHDIYTAAVRVKNNLEDLANKPTKKGFSHKVLKFLGWLYGRARLDKLMGARTYMGNLLGNSIFAAQNGFTFHPNTYQVVYEYLRSKVYSPEGKLRYRISKKRAAVAAGVVAGSTAATIDATTDKDLSWSDYLSAIAAGAAAGALGKKVIEVVDQLKKYGPLEKQLGMTPEEYFGRLQKDGVIGVGQAAQFAREVYRPDVAQVAAQTFSKTKVGQKTWYQRTDEYITEKFLKQGALTHQLMADDPWRVAFHYDCMVNRGMSWDEATAATLKAFGNFEAMYMTKAEKALSKGFWFWRFQKWLVMNQLEILRTNPKWAAILAKYQGYLTQSDTDEYHRLREMAAFSPEYMDPVLFVRHGAKIDYNMWSKKKTLSYLTAVQPFGNWFSPKDMYDLFSSDGNPLEIPAGWAKNVLESSVISSEVGGKGGGILNMAFKGFTSLLDAMEAPDGETAKKALARAGWYGVGMSRTLSYLKPLLSGAGGDVKMKGFMEKLSGAVVYSRDVPLKKEFQVLHDTALEKGRPDVASAARKWISEIEKYQHLLNLPSLGKEVK